MKRISGLFILLLIVANAYAQNQDIAQKAALDFGKAMCACFEPINNTKYNEVLDFLELTNKDVNATFKSLGYSMNDSIKMMEELNQLQKVMLDQKINECLQKVLSDMDNKYPNMQDAIGVDIKSFFKKVTEEMNGFENCDIGLRFFNMFVLGVPDSGQ